MKISEYSFDVDAIVLIKFYKESIVSHYVWTDRKPIKYFFGLINSGKYTTPGFINDCDWSKNIKTREHFIDYGYSVHDRDGVPRVYEKPVVSVMLNSNYSVEQTFETDLEAEQWVNELRNVTNKNFGVVNYKK